MNETVTVHPGIAVLALDAADHELLHRWDCQNILLDTDHRLQTHAWSTDVPSTKEVWPTVATGLTPDEHGLRLDEGTTSTWDDQSVTLAAAAADAVLPDSLTDRLGRWLHTYRERSLPQTDAPHVFDHARGWMGITPAHDLVQAHDLWSQVQDGALTESDLHRRLLAMTLTELKYLATTPGLRGDHLHILDVAGHTYARRERRLRAYYERVDRLVGWLRQECQGVVVVSDHGMQVECLGDENPGQHSMRATIAATDGLDGPLPESITDVADWLADNKGRHSTEDCTVTMDSRTDQLAALGYVDPDEGQNGRETE